MAPTKPTVLHIGDPIRYNPDTYALFAQQFDIVRPSAAERQRDAFKEGLRTGKWGQFAGIFRPFWGTGGEMGNWDRELIGLLPESCRVFASAGAGFDWVDTKTLGERGIIYCNGGLAASEAVADFAVALVISTFRQLQWCMGAAVPPAGTSDDERGRLFSNCHSQATAQSRNPRGFTLGLIGLGNIGQAIAEKMGGPAFGMEIHYFDVVRKPAEVEQKLGATFHESLKDLLGVSDCAVLCTPASTDGKPLLTKSAFAAAKKGSRFVNIARGSLVDEDALADALEDGTLSSAALDVYATEPRIHPRLLALGRMSTSAGGPLPKIMLTCHNAGGTVETHIGFEELGMRNIMAILGGRQGITPVNLHHLKSRI